MKNKRQDYIDSVISSWQNYAEQQASLKQTNDALLKEVEELGMLADIMKDCSEVFKNICNFIN